MALRRSGRVDRQHRRRADPARADLPLMRGPAAEAAISSSSGRGSIALVCGAVDGAALADLEVQMGAVAGAGAADVADAAARPFTSLSPP